MKIGEVSVKSIPSRFRVFDFSREKNTIESVCREYIESCLRTYTRMYVI